MGSNASNALLWSPHGCACSLSHLAFGLSQERIDTAWFLSAVVHSSLYESVLVLPWWKPLIYPSGQSSLATGRLFKSQPLSRAVIGVSSSSSSLLLSEAPLKLFVLRYHLPDVFREAPCFIHGQWLWHSLIKLSFCYAQSAKLLEFGCKPYIPYIP